MPLYLDSLLLTRITEPTLVLNFTKQSDVISAMVFAPVKVIATRISLSIKSSRF